MLKVLDLISISIVYLVMFMTITSILEPKERRVCKRVVFLTLN